MLLIFDIDWLSFFGSSSPFCVSMISSLFCVTMISSPFCVSMISSPFCVSSFIFSSSSSSSPFCVSSFIFSSSSSSPFCVSSFIFSSSSSSPFCVSSFLFSSSSPFSDSSLDKSFSSLLFCFLSESLISKNLNYFIQNICIKSFYLYFLLFKNFSSKFFLY